MFKIKPIYCERCFSKCNLLIYPVIDDTSLPLNLIRVSCPCCFTEVISYNLPRAVMKWYHMQVKVRKECNNV